MYNIWSRHSFWILFLVFAGQLGLGVCPAAGSLSYSFFGKVDEDATGDFIQTIRHRVSSAAEQELTEKFKASELINYSHTQEEGQESQEVLSPSLQMSLDNKFFSMYFLGATRQKIGSGSSNETDSEDMEVGWRSKWKTSLSVPRLSATVALRNLRDSNSPHQTDKTHTNLTSSADWDLHFARAILTYSSRETENLVSRREEFQENWFAKLSGSQLFRDERLRISYSYIYTDNLYEQGVVAGPGNTALNQLIVPEIRTGIDNTPTDPIELPAASANPLMIDGDLLTTAYPVPQNTVDHNFLFVVNSQQADIIYLYAQDNWGGGVPPSLNNWRLYSTDVLATVWTVETINPVTFTYDPINQRIVIPVPAVQRNYLKLVVDRSAIPLPPIDIAEGEVYDAITASSGSAVILSNKSISNKMVAGITYKLSGNGELRYSFNRGTIKGDSRQGSENLSHMVSLNLNSRDQSLRSIINYRQSLTRKDFPSQDYQADNFSIDIKKSLFGTLQFSLMATRNEISLDGQKFSLSDRYSFYCDAQLYPDLNARIDTSYTAGEVGGFGDNENLVATFQLNSRLNPDFVASFEERYEERRSLFSVAEVATSSLGFSWVLSDHLSTRFGAKYTDHGEQQDQRNAFAGCSLKATRNMDINLDYSVAEGLAIIHSGSGTWAWNIRHNLNFRATGLYSKTEGVPGNELRLNGTLTFSFRAR